MLDFESRGGPCGGSLLRWLAVSDRNLAQLRLQLLQRQAVTRFTTQLMPHRGDPQRVEVCAVGVPAGLDTSWGFSIDKLAHVH